MVPPDLEHHRDLEGRGVLSALVAPADRALLWLQADRYNRGNHPHLSALEYPSHLAVLYVQEVQLVLEVLVGLGFQGNRCLL